MSEQKNAVWYEKQFASAVLDIENDAEWFLMVAGVPLSSEVLGKANSLIPSGSINLHYETDPETFSGVVNARSEFYGEILGWEDEQHPLNKSYELVKDFAVRTVPLATFIATQRVLAAEKLNLQKLLSRNSALITLAPTSVQEKLNNLSTYGVSLKSPLENFPTLLTYSPDTLNKKLEDLGSIGLDLRSVLLRAPSVVGEDINETIKRVENLHGLGLTIKHISAAPSLLLLTYENISEKMNIFENWQLDASKIITVLPTLLALSAETLENKLTFLQKRGYKVVKIIEREPTLLSQALDALLNKLEMLRVAGIDDVKVVNNTPSVLRLSEAALALRLSRFNEHGLNAARIINAQPSALSLAPDTLTRKLYMYERIFHVIDAQTTVAQLLEVFPAALTRSCPKVMATARFIAEHGSRDTIPDTPQAAANLLVRPITNLLVAAVAEEPFSVKTVSTVRLKPAERSRVAQEILSNPELRSYIGHKCVRAFLAAQRM